MPYVQSDGARLYYETAGTGTPIVFAHEFSGDLWSWEKQIQHFSRRYRCVAYNARGYPPSEVPGSPKHYSHSKAVDDVAAVMRHLKIGKAHILFRNAALGQGGAFLFETQLRREFLRSVTRGGQIVFGGLQR